MTQRWIAAGAFSGALAVALGAFGAHALKDRIPYEDLEIWRTGVLYHAVHSLALVLFGLFQERRGSGSAPGPLFLLGIAVFAGTLYGIALGGPRWLGAVTPIGGLALIAGWVALGIQASRRRGEPRGPTGS